ncbi:MAG TPA: two-component regulator propeller domain-containing protein, partial [Blastocatellia bacterium]|nr:two-component regulator propeller domain-containing protein [Blastocatellia bacterium]
MMSLSAPARGQTAPEIGDPYLQTVWTTEEGLPQNSVNAILQTRDGYLWLGTFGGLARFDGVKFTIFNSGNTPGLKSNRILSLCEGRDGTLWLGAETGEVMSFKDGVGKTYTADDGLPGSYVWALKEDRAGTLWAGTVTGLARFQDGQFVVYTMSDGLPDNQVCSIHEDRAGRLWLATGGGVARYDGGKFTAYRPQERVLEGMFVPFVARGRGEGYWLGTRKGLAHFSEGNFTYYPNAASSPAWLMRNLLEDRDGTLWVSYHSPSLVSRFKDGKFS